MSVELHILAGVALGVLAGLGLGWVHFTSLWWVTRGLTGHGGLWPVALHLARFAVTGLALAGLAWLGAAPLLGATAGMMAARRAALRRLGPGEQA